ncbi:MAG: TraR/DksA family transcriptional regulator [Thermodesulfobacteriota bacterium]|nr:TraR/DksA family transcriptional regulator [Thermodesulfobacteriota bacterium]
MLRTKEIQHIKDILIEMKKEILEALQERVASGNINEQREIGDVFDDADLEQSREFNILLTTREKQKVQQIDAALQKMGAGNYGLCEECGEEIPIGRLKALPFATLCVKCKSKQEITEGPSIVSSERTG